MHTEIGGKVWNRRLFVGFMLLVSAIYFLGMFFIIVSLVFVSFVSSRVASVIPRLFLVDEWDKAT